jgi:hypothetical protein
MAPAAIRVAAFGRGPRLCRKPDAAGHRAGEVAGWIAPPEIGINNTPLDYKYVRLN